MKTTIVAWALSLAFVALFGLTAMLAAVGAIPALLAAAVCTVALVLGYLSATLADGGAA